MTIATDTAARPTVAMLMYPGMTLLDFVGPHETLHQHTDVHLVAASVDEVRSDGGFPFRATVSLEDAPADVDVLFVPGGAGTLEAMQDPQVLEFLADRGARARYVTSVCTGSLILGAAGLLNGYRATSHWSARHLLTHFGAQPTDGRVVIDRNRITGGGVTAGIDFGLTILAELLGRETAETVQLVLEYEPAPPFHSGTPAIAAPHVTAGVRQMLAPLVDGFAAAARARDVDGGI